MSYSAPSTMLATIAALALSISGCGDDEGGSGGSGASAQGGSDAGGTGTGAGSNTGAASNGGSGGAGAGSPGGGGAGATGTGASGTGGSSGCDRCGDAIGESFPLFCDVEAETLYDTLESCMCTFACTLDCESNACMGDEPSQDCLDCLDFDCQPQLDECLADS